MMYIIFVVGIFMWVLYGLIINDLPIIIANTMGVIQGSLILFLKMLI